MKIIHKIKKAVVSFVLTCGLMLAGCGNQPATVGPQQGQSPEVTVAEVRTQSIVITTELPGRTSSFLVAELRPQVGGIIQKRLFNEGGDVKAGDVLYQIDPAIYQATLDSALASLARSDANLTSIRLRADRYKELVAINAVSKQDYDDISAALREAEANIQVGKAAVETARINLEYTRITAPISGRIGKSNVTVGALVTMNQPAPLATIQQLDPIYVDVPQSTTELMRLKRSLESGRLNQNGESQKKVKLMMEDGTTYPLEGTLQFRDVTVDPTTGSVILRVVFPNSEGVLLPGMFVRAVIKEGVNEQAILIPQQCVSRDPKGNPVALIVDAEGKAQARMLTLDRAIGDQWLVSSGLAPGERVIAEGIQKVRPGMPVKIASSDQGDGKGPEAEKPAHPAGKSN